MKSNDKRKFAVNTAMLYALTVSNYVFGFVTIPYQTRVLGPKLYGVLGIASSTMIYVQTILDFGYTLSATADIAVHRDDKTYIKDKLSSILASKFLLAIPCMIVISAMCTFIPQFSDYKNVFAVYLCYIVINSLIPDFLYRGMEDMKPITYRTIAVKLIFTLGIFVLLKKETDYIVVPTLYLLGAVVAVIISYIDVKRRFGVSVVKVTKKQILSTIKMAAPFFVSRIASTVYGATNTLLLGMVYTGGEAAGYYTSADKCISLAKSGVAPISDSLYPYLVNKRDFRLVRKILTMTMPVIVIAATLAFLYARQLCIFVFGKNFESAATPLRALLPVAVVALPSYIMGFPMMTPLHVERYANYSVVVGAVLQILFLCVLIAMKQFTVLNVCIATSITEIVVLSYRITVVKTALKRKKF